MEVLTEQEMMEVNGGGKIDFYMEYFGDDNSFRIGMSICW